MQSKDEYTRNKNEITETLRELSDALEYVGKVIEYKPEKKWVAPKAARGRHES